MKWLDPYHRDVSEQCSVYEADRYEMMCNHPGRWDLVIKKVSQSDGGNHTCRIFLDPVIDRVVELVVGGGLLFALNL